MIVLFELALLSVGVVALIPVVVALFGDREPELVPVRIKAERPQRRP